MVDDWDYECIKNELAEARVQIAAKDAALREVREHLFDIAHHPNSPIIAKIDAALAAPTQEKSK